MLYLNDVEKKVIKIINKALLQVIIDGYKFLLEYLGTYCTKIFIKGFILSGTKVTAEWIWVARKPANWFEHGWFYGVLCLSNVTPRLSSSFLSFSVLKMSFAWLVLRRLLIFLSVHGTVAAGYNGISAKGTLGRRKEKLRLFASSHHPSRLLLDRVNRRLGDDWRRVRLHFEERWRIVVR